MSVCGCVSRIYAGIDLCGACAHASLHMCVHGCVCVTLHAVCVSFESTASSEPQCVLFSSVASCRLVRPKICLCSSKDDPHCKTVSQQNQSWAERGWIQVINRQPTQKNPLQVGRTTIRFGVLFSGAIAVSCVFTVCSVLSLLITLKDELQCYIDKVIS